MHIGISRPPTPPHPIPDVDGGAIARIAEQVGFESVFYGEHPITPLDDPGYLAHSSGVPFFQDTLVMLARASAMTTRIKLGSAVFLIPEHQAVMFAKHLSSLDFYSGGRLIIGAGVGWSRVECEVMGGNFDRRWAQTRECIQLMKRLWSQEVAEFDGEFYKMPPVKMFPKPATKPWPPVLLPGPFGPTGNDVRELESQRSITAFKRIVTYGDGWLPALFGDDNIQSGPELLTAGRKVLERLCVEAGRDPKQMQITALLRVPIHDGDLTPRDMLSRDLLKRYEDSGVERIIITMSTVTNEAEAKQVLDHMASSYL